MKCAACTTAPNFRFRDVLGFSVLWPHLRNVRPSSSAILSGSKGRSVPEEFGAWGR
jgi:hypothetical protein